MLFQSEKFLFLWLFVAACSVLHGAHAYADEWDAFSDDFSYEQDQDFGEQASKRQLVPLPRYGRGSVVPPPRVGRRGSVIPSPRVGRAGNLMAAPRVGRAGSGLLAAPRVGRSGTGILAGPWVGQSYWAIRDMLKRQGIIPAPRVGRASSVLAVPRVGRSTGILPSPRVGRAPRPSDWWVRYRGGLQRVHPIPANVAAALHDNESSDESSNAFSNSTSSIRSKRSSQLDDSVSFDGDELELDKSFRDWLTSSMTNAEQFHRSSRQLIPSPRVGRRSGSSSDSKSSSNESFDLNAFLGSYAAASAEDDLVEGSDPVDLQLRAVYIPRYGKGLGQAAMAAIKRAAFTPRIGRAVAFTPRLGRSSWDISPGNAEDEMVYEARPGRAAFTPRIGRSVPAMDKEQLNKAD